MLLQGRAREGRPERSPAVTRRRSVGIGGWVVAVALLLGPTATPLADWLGVPIAADGCLCPPARCSCRHEAPRHLADADADCVGRPSCPRQGSAAPRASAAASHHTAAAGHHAKAASHATAHRHAAVASTPGGRDAAASCSIASRCDREDAPAGTGTVTWLQAAGGSGAAWSAPAGPGAPSPLAADLRLLERERLPESPPPRRIAPIA